MSALGRKRSFANHGELIIATGELIIIDRFGDAFAPSQAASALEDIRLRYLSHIVHALDQLPRDRRCVVHVGYEAVNGDVVEQARRARFRDSMNAFDPKGIELEYVYSHCLVPESPQDKAWLFRETGSWHGIRVTRERPLRSPILVLPADQPDLEGGHWLYRDAWGDG